VEMKYLLSATHSVGRNITTNTNID